MSNNMKALFNTRDLDELVRSIPTEEKDNLDLESCSYSFSDDGTYVVIDGPVNVVDGLKRKIPFFVDALEKLRAIQRERELKEMEKEIAAFMSAKSNAV